MAVFVDAEAFIVGFHFANHARVAIHFLKKKKSSFKIVLFNYWQKSFNLFWQYCQRKLSAHWSKIRIFVHLLDLDQIVKFLRSILNWFFLSFFSIFFRNFWTKIGFLPVCILYLSSEKFSTSNSQIPESNQGLKHGHVPFRCTWLQMLEMTRCNPFRESGFVDLLFICSFVSFDCVANFVAKPKKWILE